jgi:alanyl-tRNA synthetase
MSYALYYDTPYETEFTARIVSREETKKGPAVVLDRTLFYPEGGGQPSDVGVLGGAAVRAVKKRDGEILHYLSAEPEVDAGEGAVRGRIDWSHRYDYMQQHTGQHILSAVMYRRYGYQTVSVHQGSEYITIEVEADSLDEELIRAFEDEAAALIARNEPVRAVWVSEEEAAGLDLRREPKVSGEIRIVKVDDFDAVACGGIHTATTGEVKLVKHVGTERIRGRQRLYWKIGDRAVRDYRLRTKVTAELSDLLSVPTEGIPERTRGLVEELTALRGEYAALEDRLAAQEVRRLSEAAETIETAESEESAESAESAQSIRAAFGEYHGEGKDFLRRLGDAVKEGEERLLLCAVNHSEKGMQWLVAAGPGVVCPFNEHRRELLEPIAGKGGGKPPVWQGVGEEPVGLAEFYRRLTSIAGPE